MGRQLVFAPERLVIGILISPEAGIADEEHLALELRSLFGIFEPGPRLAFTWSSYYDDEMGGRPTRFFAAFNTEVDPGSLASIKAATNKLEAQMTRRDGGRLFNLDPGLLSLSRFVLATTKERPHRLPLADGIFGELTLIYDSGEYRPLAWTYPDWASPEYRDYLGRLRSSMRSSRRARLRTSGTTSL